MDGDNLKDNQVISKRYIPLRMAVFLTFAIMISLSAPLFAGCQSKTPSENNALENATNAGEDAAKMVTVPDLRGLSETEAKAALESIDLKPIVGYENGAESSEGMVVAQNPQAGEELRENDSVSLTVAGVSEEKYLGYIVCLDPGHAATPYQIDAETGLNTQDWANVPEMEIVFDIATRTQKILEDRGIRVVMTKQNVSDPVDLKQRAIIANDANASLILHIHTDPGISSPTTFYPGASPNDWKGNYETGGKAYVDPQVQQNSERLAQVFQAAMATFLQGRTGVQGGGTRMENRGSTGTGNYGPVLSYDVWSEVPTFTIENNQEFADSHRQEIAEAISEGIIACHDAP